MRIRKANDRGLTHIEWLYSRHSFSFGEYYDPQVMGFRALRVINDDVIEPGHGFGMHGHRDMEIITVVVEGCLEHRDSLGHGKILRPGEVQVMTAGRGIRHSEFNPSTTAPVRLIQVWIEPSEIALTPAYAQEAFPMEDRINKLLRVAGPESSTDRALRINPDAHIYVSILQAGMGLNFQVRASRGVWIQIVQGACAINGESVQAGDGIACEDEGLVSLTGEAETTEIILFDLS
jgi:hypothetical protein